MLEFPKLYAIVDAAYFSESDELYKFAQELIAGGATIYANRGDIWEATSASHPARGTNH